VTHMEGGHTYNTEAHVQYRDADANVDVYNGRQGVTQGGPRTVHLQHITTAERAAKVAQGRRRGRVHNQGGERGPTYCGHGDQDPWREQPSGVVAEHPRAGQDDGDDLPQGKGGPGGEGGQEPGCVGPPVGQGRHLALTT
jgi:hypothetical protein